MFALSLSTLRVSLLRNGSRFSTSSSSFVITNKLHHHHRRIRVPGEFEPHSQTYMVWPGDETRAQAGSQFVMNCVEVELANIARQISTFEPITVIVDPKFRESPAALLKNHDVEILQLPSNDIWARDSLPVFAIAEEGRALAGLDVNYHKEWKNGQVHTEDSSLAQTLFNALPPLREYSSTATFVSEGGALEFDGEGTLLLTESSIFNPNRNPQFKSRDELEVELLNFFQLDKVIWLKGDYDTMDSTDVHVDALARCVEPGSVALSWPQEEGGDPSAAEEALEVLQRETDAKGRNFRITKLLEPNPQKVWRTMPNGYKNAPIYSYVNFLILNGGVVVPQFGDEEADAQAVDTLQALFGPFRKVVPVPAIYVGKMGGAVHCVTKHVPKLLSSDEAEVNLEQKVSVG